MIQHCVEFEMDKAARDNRANQLNPNNRAYHLSRAHAQHAGGDEDWAWWQKGLIAGAALVGAALVGAAAAVSRAEDSAREEKNS